MRRSLAAIPLAALVLSTTVACGDDSPSGSTPSDTEAIQGLTVTGDFGKEPTVKVDGLNVDKTQTATLIEGDGAEVTKDTSVKFRFYAANGTSGKQLASNYSDPDPQTLDLATPGPFGKALIGAHVGDRVAVAEPVTEMLAGGDAAPPEGLTKKDDVVLVFDLLEEVQPPLDGPKGTKVTPPADAPTVVEKGGDVTGFDFATAAAKPPTKLQVIPLIEGDGAVVKEDDQLTVDYFGAVYGKRTAFDESYSKEPVTFPLTKGQLIDGWVQGLQGVKVGSRVMLVIPPEQGYGEKGSPPNIPPNATLVFVIDVLGANL